MKNKGKEKSDLLPRDEELDLKPPRISVKHMMNATLSILNFDRGIFYTLKAMLLRPGLAMRHYLESDRSKYVHPLRFLFLSAAIAAFISTQFVFQSDEFQKGFVSGVEVGTGDDDSESEALPIEEGKPDGTQLKVSPEDDSTEKERIPEFNKKEIQQKVGGFIIDLMNRYFSLILILYVPFAAFATFLFFRKNKLYLGEHLAVNAFLIGFVNVLYILFIPFAIIFSNSFIIGGWILVAALYQLIFYMQVFERNTFKGFMLSSLAIGFSGLIYFAIVFTTMAVILTNYLNTIAPLK